jgi:uncharacterized protein
MLFGTISAFGASFDCAKASSNVEKMICADPELSALDENLSKVFKEAMKSTDDKDQLKKDQFAWMKERNKCKAVKCIKEKYQEKLVLFENTQYFKQLKIDDNASLYYVDYHVLIPDLQSGKYQIDKECAQCKKNEVCEDFIEDVKNNRNIEWLAPTVQTIDFNDPSLQQYLQAFPAWIQSQLKERVYLTTANRYFDKNRENSDWNDYPYQTKFIKLYEIKDVKNPYYFILADGFYNPKLGLFGEKREINGAYSTSDEALGIYALLDKNSKKIDKFDYIESTVKLSKKMSRIREIIKYRQQIYLFESNYDLNNNHYYSIILSPIENQSTKKSIVLDSKCVFNIIEEK